MEPRTLLLVGLGPGLGLSLSREFARNGFRIAFVVQDAATVDKFTQLFTQEGITSTGAVADASQPASLKEGMAQLIATWGAPDVFIYNVSIFRMQPPTQVDPDEFTYDLKLNVVGALAGAQAAAAAMLQRGSGTLFFTGGGSALKPAAQFTSLGLGKAGMRWLVMCLAEELCPQGLAVGTFTINGAMQPGTPFAPDTVAKHYYQFCSQLTPASEPELIFNGG